ncbi:hypothetical protein Taro_016587 [Colocasia esculenta]|uniref:Uncharacterized protein n=1 Tax=Colocasia esculenta TaxID=4460 RepID=A0A843UQQ9_COLES|nr:hypothetical protein [Colocasia esculenta]
MCTSTPTAVPSGRTRIFIRPGVGTAREAPIQNRHFDPVGKWSHSEISGAAPKFLSGSAVAGSDSLDYANRWRITHAEPPSHSDWMSCSTRREISSPGSGYGCPNSADITVDRALVSWNSVPGPKFPPERNRHSETVDRALVSWNSISGPKCPPVRVYEYTDCRTLRSDADIYSPGVRNRPRGPNSESALRSGRSDSLDYANRWRIPHAEPPSHNNWKSCSTRREISSPVATPSITRIAGGSHKRSRQSQRSEVVFNSTRDLLPSSDSLDYANRWRLPQAEPPSHSDRKSCSTRREISSPVKELGITFRTGIGIAYVTTIRNRHSEMVARALVLRNSVPGPKSPPERVYGAQIPLRERGRRLPMRSHTDTPSDSLDYANRWRIPHAELPSHSDRKSCSTRREISSPVKELGITFRTGIGIAYGTIIWNRHSETVDRALVSRNSVLGAKSSPEHVY